MIVKEDAVSVISGIVGTKEDPAKSNHNFITEWYANTSGLEWARSGNPWCAMTISWVLQHIGMKWFLYAYCPYLERDARKGLNGMSWDKEPRVGSPVLYDLEGSNMATHVGMVTEVHDDGTFSTVEGNWRDAVTPLVRDMKYVRGFVYLPYDASASNDQGDDDVWTEDEKKALLAAVAAHGEALGRLEDSVRGGSGVLPIVEQVRDGLLPAKEADKPLGKSSIDNQIKMLRRGLRKVAGALNIDVSHLEDEVT